MGWKSGGLKEGVNRSCMWMDMNLWEPEGGLGQAEQPLPEMAILQSPESVNKLPYEKKWLRRYDQG